MVQLAASPCKYKVRHISVCCRALRRHLAPGTRLGEGEQRAGGAARARRTWGAAAPPLALFPWRHPCHKEHPQLCTMVRALVALAGPLSRRGRAGGGASSSRSRLGPRSCARRTPGSGTNAPEAGLGAHDTLCAPRPLPALPQDTPAKLAIVMKVIGRTGSRGQVRGAAGGLGRLETPCRPSQPAHRPRPPCPRPCR